MLSTAEQTQMNPEPSPPPAAAATAAAAAARSAPLADFSAPDRRLLYALIVRQLHDDGLDALADALTAATGAPAHAALPPNQLSAMVATTLAQLQAIEIEQRQAMRLGRTEQRGDEDADEQKEGADDDEGMGAAKPTAAGAVTPAAPASATASAAAPAFPSLLDLTLPSVSASKHSTQFPPYIQCFQSSHNDSVTSGAFSADGSLFVTGARDGQLRLFDTTRAKANLEKKFFSPATASGATAAASSSASARGASASSGLKPQLHRWSDFDGLVSGVAFHPFESMILAGSRDHALKFFAYDRALAVAYDPILAARIPDPSASKATKLMGVESAPITALSFHPSGDWALIATEQHFPRIYDVRSFSAFTSPDFGALHAGAILDAGWDPARGATYATASVDGSVKLWDALSSTCVRTISRAHGGAAVCGVTYSPSGQYLLTTGLDSSSQLWEVSSGRCVQSYVGVAHAHAPGVRASFDHTGEFVLAGDTAAPGVGVWDARTGEMVRRIDTVHGVVRAIVSSPVEPAFFTCSDDHRMRLFTV